MELPIRFRRLKIVKKKTDCEIKKLKNEAKEKENLSHIKERQLFTETDSVPQSRELECH